MRSRLLSSLAAAAALLSAPAVAGSSSTTRIFAVVPPMCAIDVLGSDVQDNRIVLTIRRTCNTSHTITINGMADADLGRITLHYGNQAVVLGAGSGMIRLPEAYYDGIDRVTLETQSGDRAELMRYAGSLAIDLQVV